MINLSLIKLFYKSRAMKINLNDDIVEYCDLFVF